MPIFESNQGGGRIFSGRARKVEPEVLDPRKSDEQGQASETEHVFSMMVNGVLQTGLVRRIYTYLWNPGVNGGVIGITASPNNPLNSFSNIYWIKSSSMEPDNQSPVNVNMAVNYTPNLNDSNSIFITLYEGPGVPYNDEATVFIEIIGRLNP